MNSEQGRDMLAALHGRYNLELDTGGWGVRQISGGVALSDEMLEAICSTARRMDDDVAVVFEMESSAKEFAPLTVSLTNDGFRTLRQNLISHFDLVMVPASRQWALVMSHELEGMLFGPESFLAAIDAHPVNAQHVAD